MGPPPLLLYQSLAVSPAMYSSLAIGRGSASLEHVHWCCGDAQLLTFKTGGNRSFCVPGYDLPLAHRSERRKVSVVAQSQYRGQSIRSRRASQVPGEEQSKIILVANHSATGAKSQTSAVAPPPFPPPQPQIGSPLLWIGVGVGISIFFSWAARRVQSYAMQQALKSMMQQTGQGGNPFAAGLGRNMQGGNPFAAGLGNNMFGKNANPFSGQGADPFAGMPPGSFPFPSPPVPSSPAASTVTVDVAATPVPSPPLEVQGTIEKPTEIKKTAFTDVIVDLLGEEEPITQKRSLDASQEEIPFKVTGAVDGATSSTDPRSYGGQTSTSEAGKGQSFVSMDMLERMLDDPKIQQMVFPYLPEEMRDPVTFKRMIQLPPVRQQLQEALNNMGGEDGLDMLKYMNSDVVKEQFEQIGLTPEEVVGKILANPDIAASLQNSRVVEAIMDCSQNPLNITKYQNDKEVMNALLKIAELFPGATGSP